MEGCIDRPRTDRPEPAPLETTRRRIDVTDLHAAAVDEYVRARIDTDRVSLEHRGARTYLVIDEAP